MREAQADLAAGRKVTLSPTSRIARAVLRPAFRKIAQMELTRGERFTRLSFGARMQRLFANPNVRHPGLSETPFGGLLLKAPFAERLNWQQGHTFVQRRLFRPRGPSQWYPNDYFANLGLRRVGNAGLNLVPMPGGINLALGGRPWASLGTGLAVGAAAAGTAAWTASQFAGLGATVGPDSPESGATQSPGQPSDEEEEDE
jgi:hypothetical protein